MWGWHRLDRQLLYRRLAKCSTTLMPPSRPARQPKRLAAHGITVLDLNATPHLDVYVDGADEIDALGNMIKGGGAALTREKIVASAANEFVCVADDSKLVTRLGAFPLPVEVIPMARSWSRGPWFNWVDSLFGARV